MVLVKKFKKLSARTYDNFTDCPEFEKYNLIYGSNGSGKTTIADVFRMIEKKEDYFQKDANFVIELESKKEITEKNFEKASLPVRVFNRTFVERNVFNEKDGMSSIITLGEENIEKKSKLENLNKVKQTITAYLQEEKKNNYALNKDKETLCTNLAKRVRDNLKITNTSSFNKNALEDFLKLCITENKVAPKDSLENLKQKVYGDVKKKLEKISFKMEDEDGLEKLFQETNQLLQTTPTSKTIERLQKNADLSAWIRTGLNFHKNQENCQFCEKKLPDSLLISFERHFDESFTKLDSDLKSQKDKINQIIDRLDEIVTPIEDQFYKDKIEENIKSIKILDETKKKFIECLKKLIEKIDIKISNLFNKTITLKFSEIYRKKETTFLQSIESFNKIVDDHNSITDNFEKEQNSAKESIKLLLASKELKKYKKLQKDIESSDKKIKNLEEQLKYNKSEIESIENNINNYKLPMEYINKGLKQCLGHESIQLRYNETETRRYYEVIRNFGVEEKIATALSEGEKTVIAMIYFLNSLKDKSFDLKNGVVVIDDPVSSLDSGMIFNIYNYITKHFEEVGQLFILTHNFTFLNIIKKWEKLKINKGKEDQNTFLQTITIFEKDTKKRKTIIKKMDEFLIKYDSEYHYLFKSIYELSEYTGESIEEFYHLPNMARRLLEAFFAFKNPKKKLSNILQKDHSDISRFVNLNSHHDWIILNEGMNQDIIETPKVLKQILNLISEKDEEHCNQMKALVKP